MGGRCEAGVEKVGPFLFGTDAAADGGSGNGWGTTDDDDSASLLLLPLVTA